TTHRGNSRPHKPSFPSSSLCLSSILPENVSRHRVRRRPPGRGGIIRSRRGPGARARHLGTDPFSGEIPHQRLSLCPRLCSHRPHEGYLHRGSHSDGHFSHVVALRIRPRCAGPRCRPGRQWHFGSRGSKPGQPPGAVPCRSAGGGRQPHDGFVEQRSGGATRRHRRSICGSGGRRRSLKTAAELIELRKEEFSELKNTLAGRVESFFLWFFDL
ncbi:unnamed protein product, partial [Musa hybrid cultivar]